MSVIIPAAVIIPISTLVARSKWDVHNGLIGLFMSYTMTGVVTQLIKVCVICLWTWGVRDQSKGERDVEGMKGYKRHVSVKSRQLRKDLKGECGVRVEGKQSGSGKEARGEGRDRT